MASKLTAKTENTSPAATDVIYIVDDPGGSPASQKLTLGTLATYVNNLYTLPSTQYDFCINWAFDSGGTTALTSKILPGIKVPRAGTIQTWEINSGTINGNGTFDVYKSTYANLPTAAADTIIGTATKPSIAGTSMAIGTPTTWGTVTFSAGDWLTPELTGAGTINQVTLALIGKWTA